MRYVQNTDFEKPTKMCGISSTFSKVVGSVLKDENLCFLNLEKMIQQGGKSVHSQDPSHVYTKIMEKAEGGGA